MKTSFVVTLEFPDRDAPLDPQAIEVARALIQRRVAAVVESAGIHVTVTLQTGLPLHPFHTP